MNGFRALADAVHALAFALLFYKIFKFKSCEGISAKTQILYALVFTFRYTDLIYSYDYPVSLYTVVFKILFILATYLLVYLICFHFKETYEKKYDALRVEFLVIAAFLLALYHQYDFTAIEISWAFSIYLEIVAILPQMYQIIKAGKPGKYILLYVGLLGIYRTLYVMNWIYRFYKEHHHDPISTGCGYLQTLLYMCFFIYYCFCFIQSDGKSFYASNLQTVTASTIAIEEKLINNDSIYIIENDKTLAI